MPKIKDIKKVLVIGSGPIVIGQAAEFDYAGAQACRVLKEEGLNVVLVNSNPATIMTDKHLADDWRFVKETVAFYFANRDFLYDGEMLNPGRLECAQIAFDFIVRGTYTTEETLAKVKTVSPSVLHSVWRAPDGRVAAILVNWTRQKQKFALDTPDATASGIIEPRSWKLISFTKSGKVR